jgi:hypothetical protein
MSDELKPCPDYWFEQQTTDGRKYLAGFVNGQTAAVEHIVVAPDGTIETQWRENTPCRTN